jgi:hypothetical protein
LPGIAYKEKKANGRWDKQFMQACKEAELEQHVDFPTQVGGNTLDLLLTNVPKRIKETRK